MRFLAGAAITVLLFGLLSFSQQSPGSGSPTAPLSVADVEHGLKAGVSNTRMAALVKQYGVDFDMTDDIEKQLRAAGANGDLLLEVSRNRQTSDSPPASSSPPQQSAPIIDIEIAEIDGKINEIGKLAAHVHYTVRGGDEEQMLRSVFRRVPEAQWPQVIEKVNAHSRMGGEITNLKVSDPTETREPFTLSYDIATSNFLDQSKKQSDLTLPFCTFYLPEINPGDASAQPLKLGKRKYVYKIKLELPLKYTAHAPLLFSLKRDYAEYEATYKLEGTTFTAGRTLTIHQDELPAPRGNDYSAFRRAVGSDLDQVLSIENTVAATPTPPAGTPSVLSHSQAMAEREISSPRSQATGTDQGSSGDAYGNDLTPHDCVKQGITPYQTEGGYVPANPYPVVALQNTCSKAVSVYFCWLVDDLPGNEWACGGADIEAGKSTGWLQMAEKKLACVDGRPPDERPDPRCSHFTVVWNAVYLNSNQKASRPNVPQRRTPQSAH